MSRNKRITDDEWKAAEQVIEDCAARWIIKNADIAAELRKNPLFASRTDSALSTLVTRVVRKKRADVSSTPAKLPEGELAQIRNDIRQLRAEVNAYGEALGRIISTAASIRLNETQMTIESEGE